MQDRDLESNFTAELSALEQSGAGMPLVLKPSEAWYLLAILQLALSHPALQAGSGSADYARALAENIEGRLCRTPAMKEVARLGWVRRPANERAAEPPMMAEPAAAPEPKPAAAPKPEPEPEPKERFKRKGKQ